MLIKKNIKEIKLINIQLEEKRQNLKKKYFNAVIVFIVKSLYLIIKIAYIQMSGQQFIRHYEGLIKLIMLKIVQNLGVQKLLITTKSKYNVKYDR